MVEFMLKYNRKTSAYHQGIHSTNEVNEESAVFMKISSRILKAQLFYDKYGKQRANYITKQDYFHF